MDTTSQIKLDTLVWVALTIAFIIGTSVATGWIARFVARRLKLSRTEQRRIFWGFTFAGPWIVGFLIFTLLPILSSFYYSFTRYSVLRDPVWIGLGNYVELFTDDRLFPVILINTLIFVAFGVPLRLVV